MNLKIEMQDSKDIQEFQEFVYDRQPELVIDEITAKTPGYNREPIIIALVVALGGPVILQTVQTLIKEYYAYKTAKEKEVTKRLKSATESETIETLFKFSADKNGTWTEVKYSDLVDLKLGS